MKIESKIKDSDEDKSESPSGEFTQEDLERMLNTVVKAKEIQADDGAMKLLKEYAKSKSDHIKRLLLDQPEEVKSLEKGIDKIKSKAQSKLNSLAEMEDEDED